MGFDLGLVRRDGFEGIGELSLQAHHFGFRALGAQHQGLDRRLQVVVRGDRRLQLPGKLRHVQVQVGIGPPLERQKLGQLAYLVVELLQGAITARYSLTEEELGEDEHHDEEDEDKQQSRQGIDETGPDVGAALRAGDGGHGAIDPFGLAVCLS